MHVISYLQATPTDPEIVTVQVSMKELEELQKDPQVWINKHEIFSKNVSAAKLVHTWDPKKGQTTWQVVIIHQLSCTAAVVPVPVEH